MNTTFWRPTVWLTTAFLLVLSQPAASGQPERPSGRFQALACDSPILATTWGIMERDGAGRDVQRYLSSLFGGEEATGVIRSPSFIIGGDAIRFTHCGHDHREGPRGENYIALVDVCNDETLIKTPPPQNDALQTASWDVSKYRGREVRIEVHDGNNENAFAWLGVGMIDAGPALRVDFRRDRPTNWEQSQPAGPSRYEYVAGGVPFRRDANAFGIIPPRGDVVLPAGFKAERIYALGCTVVRGTPGETHGAIELHYRAGSPDVVPLIYGFTLDGAYKLPSSAACLRLHATGDPHQYCLVIRPRDEVIEKIRLVAEPNRYPVPRITALTCETDAKSERLLPLPSGALAAAEEAWINTHAISADGFKFGDALEEVRRAHHLPALVADVPVRFRKHRLDAAFRSEGVAVADFNADGQLDITAGNVYYAGPDRKMVPLVGAPREFNRYGYSDDFLCFADDLDRDGDADLITVGFPGAKTHWLENPGSGGGPWQRHLAIEKTGNESPAYADVDGDGVKELVFFHDGRCCFAQPAQHGTDRWPVRAISARGDPAPGHGLGIGDVNGDGRDDVLVPDGYWEQPSDSAATTWPFRPADFTGGAQLCVADFDGDGDSDVLGSEPHGYGVSWSEQTPEGWRIHTIDSSYSQTHAIHLADLNRDGLLDFVTGKRFWAHNGHDPGSFEPAWLCWYEQQRRGGKTLWKKHIIDADSGVGLHFEIVDLNGDDRLDIVTATKKGVFYFEQQPASPGP